MDIRRLVSNFLSHQRIKASLPYIKGNILDLGCGGAQIIDWLKPNQSYIGVEKRSRVYQRLLEVFPDRKFYQFDLEKQMLNFQFGFDTVLMLAVVEHLKKPEGVFKQIPNLLNQNGYLIVTTPSPIGNVLHTIGAKLGIFSLQAAKEHYSIYNLKSFKSTIMTCGLTLVYYRKFLLSGNQLFICKIRGS